ncbi:MAG: hypothetical protein K0R88_1442 [Solirubrobacterales bacterium]|jgi:sulfide:quinone oxidoreductase|nr:hypothetical protein [Solirubrobacterales bacterium]
MAPLRVVIAGGGIAAVEAVLALDDLAGDRARVELVAPEQRFVCRPHLVAEPFSLGSAVRIELSRLAGQHHAHSRRDALATVDPSAHAIRTRGGARLEYDALLIAIGARPVTAVDGALTFGDRPGREAFRVLLGELEGAERARVVFAVPAQARWSLPAYELALLSAAHLRARGVAGIEISLATHEPRPLELLGESAPEVVGELLAEAGIDLRLGSAPRRFEAGRLELQDGEMPADHVISLPALEVPGIDGIPQRAGGFIPTDGRLNVEGLTDVWAAGDATRFPIKQGGLAAQQADIAAQAIAVRAGAKTPISTFRPVLRAALLTGALPRYFRSALFAGYEEAASVSALWSPPTKLAGRYLGPYLSTMTHAGLGDEGAFVALEAPTSDDLAAEDQHQHLELEFALAAADADARVGNYAGALAWLRLVEELALVLPPAYRERREAWQRRRQHRQAGRDPAQ